MSEAMRVSEVIDRDLNDEPQSVVRVSDSGTLASDLREYVLTDALAGEFAKVLEHIIEGGETRGAGIWVSGFFGSGKSYFAKLAGHLLANTPVGTATARDLFAHHLQDGRPHDQRIRELFQQATIHKVAPRLVMFDITAESTSSDSTVGMTFLRAFYQSFGYSRIVAFAEREAELEAAGKYQEFTRLYEQKSGVSWAEDKDLNSSDYRLAECLATLLPQRYPSSEVAWQSLDRATRQGEQTTIGDIVAALRRWLDGASGRSLLFVVDEVGAWASRDLRRVEEIRAMIEAFGDAGHIAVIATSQEALSSVVQNTTSDGGLLQRLTARFRTNVHLESSEVGTVIEQRILLKKATAHPTMGTLWSRHAAQVTDVAAPPGLELGGIQYPKPNAANFADDYPFLPYQLPAAADIFGAMRGVRVSAGARSMLKVAFDATRGLAGRPLGAVVSWDRIFDAANRDNEFAAEEYLGSQGLTYLRQADRDVTDVPIVPSRLLKILWLIGKSARIPRTVPNLARLLLDDLSADLQQLERDVERTLIALEGATFVRSETGSKQWQFLSQDQVTVEKLVQEIARDLTAKEVRDEVSRLYTDALKQAYTGRLRHGKSNTQFTYGLFFNDAPLANESAPVSLRAVVVGSGTAHLAKQAEEQNTANLDAPLVVWLLEPGERLEERVRRALAIERLPDSEEYRRVATARTKIEADNLRADADRLRREAEEQVARALGGGRLLYAGQTIDLDGTTTRTQVETALKDRIDIAYDRFAEGDRVFNANNVDKLFTVPAADRAGLDPTLGLFSPDGHLNGANVLAEEMAGYLTHTTKTAGADVVAHFDRQPFGWQADLVRYVATAMFVDGKLSALDKNGKRYENPREQGAKALFGTAPFRATRLEVQEDSLSPAELSQARQLLTDLGVAPDSGDEIAVREATQRLHTRLVGRLGILAQARDADLPLPTAYDAIPQTVEEIATGGSRAVVIRALLAQAEALREADANLARLETFAAHGGFVQFTRSRRLLEAVRSAGLDDDSESGELAHAATQLDALYEQRRVLDEWDGQYKNYRAAIVRGFRAAYEPLRRKVAEETQAANADIREMPEYATLKVDGTMQVRTEYLGKQRPLDPVPMPALHDEQQLLAANDEYRISHLRTILDALPGQTASARAFVRKLAASEEDRQRTVVWKTADAFGTHRFEKEEDVDAAFDAAKEAIKTLVRQGKIVEIA